MYIYRDTKIFYDMCLNSFVSHRTNETETRIKPIITEYNANTIKKLIDKNYSIFTIIYGTCPSSLHLQRSWKLI